jgi:hypothetical protein
MPKPFDRYSRIRALMAIQLATKTGWGRNELLSALDTVLLAVAEEEIEIESARQPDIKLQVSSISHSDMRI